MKTEMKEIRKESDNREEALEKGFDEKRYYATAIAPDQEDCIHKITEKNFHKTCEEKFSHISHTYEFSIENAIKEYEYRTLSDILGALTSDQQDILSTQVYPPLNRSTASKRLKNISQSDILKQKQYIQKRLKELTH